MDTCCALTSSPQEGAGHAGDMFSAASKELSRRFGLLTWKGGRKKRKKVLHLGFQGITEPPPPDQTSSRGSAAPGLHPTTSSIPPEQPLPDPERLLHHDLMLSCAFCSIPHAHRSGHSPERKI